MIQFLKSRKNWFEFEHLNYVNGKYQHKAFLQNTTLVGNVSVDFTRDVIGTASFEMQDSEDINFLSDLIRPWYCLDFEDTEYKYPLGTYMLQAPNRTISFDCFRNIQAYDLLLALDQNKLTTSYTAASGENVIELVKELLDDVGTWVNYEIPDSDETLSENMTYEIGRSTLYVINGLLNAINYYPLYCTGMGVFNAKPWTENSSVIWEFLDDKNSLYESDIEEIIDYTEMYNKALIVTNQTEGDTAPLVSIGTFELYGLEAHPLSYTNIGRYITKKFDSEATSQAYVDLRAKREIYKMLELETGLNYRHAFATTRNDGLPSQGDCYRFRNTVGNIDAVYKIQSFSWSLKNGELMNSQLRRIVDAQTL